MLYLLNSIDGYTKNIIISAGNDKAATAADIKNENAIITPQANAAITATAAIRSLYRKTHG